MLEKPGSIQIMYILQNVSHYLKLLLIATHCDQQR